MRKSFLVVESCNFLLETFLTFSFSPNQLSRLGLVGLLQTLLVVDG